MARKTLLFVSDLAGLLDAIFVGCGSATTISFCLFLKPGLNELSPHDCSFFITRRATGRGGELACVFRK